MAEIMAPTHNPDDKFSRVYSQWGDGGWGLILTGGLSLPTLIPQFAANSNIGHFR